MKREEYIVWMGLAAAAGTAIGMLAERKNPAKGGFLGAAAGLLACSVAAGICEYTSRDEVPFYSSLSPLYEEAEVA